MILKSSRALYLHIDCNCFFVSCERVRNPSLKDVPVIVAGDIVLASSYECKKYGVITGMPIWKAKKLVGECLIVCPPDLSYYRNISERFFCYLKDIFEEIEPFSIDETFIYIGDNTLFGTFEESEKFIHTLQQDILTSIGIPVSIGMAATRIKAKIFSDLHKPLGYYISEDTTDNEQFTRLRVTKVPFIAKGTQEKLGIGVTSIADFMHLSYFHVKQLLGKHGVTIWLELHGIDVWKDTSRGKQQKTLIRSKSYSQGITDNREIIWTRLCENFYTAYQDIIIAGLMIQELGIFFRTKEFLRIEGMHCFHEPVNDKKILLNTLKELFISVWKTHHLYRTTGIFFGKISNGRPQQLCLFDQINIQQNENAALENTLLNLKRRYGKSIISIGKKRDKIESII